MKFLLKHKVKTLLVMFGFAISYLISTVIATCIIDETLVKYTTYSLNSIIASLSAIVVLVVLLGLHSTTYRRASFLDIFKVVIVSVVIYATSLIIRLIFGAPPMIWCTCTFLVFFIVSSVMVCSMRMYYMFLAYLRRRRYTEECRVLIVGAGDAGTTILKELRSSDKIRHVPVGFIDDNEDLHNSYVQGVKVLGGCKDIKEYVEMTAANMIIVAIPTASASDMKRITEYCINTGCEVKVLPGIYQLINGKVSVTRLRNVDVCDLLGREPVSVNLDEVMGYIEGNVILVTGGGGSIGSELCRQIANKNPKQLIILDIFENGAYEIEQELVRRHPALHLTTLIASVRDYNKMRAVFEEYRPCIVFHAAAHKHVPLMESSPCEAVKNNVIGTYNVVRCADEFGVLRFVQISTDKAVNPTNIMGATKRVCEMIIQAFAKKSSTRFVAVRFGNVLGSNGSVIPLFKKQIADGGPVTVTHKDIIRYFMTIPEAVSLVLQAGAYAKGGEIFVLDMGEQVRIYDLATKLIRLMGYEPFVDIDIKVTGLRPGEKLYEERLMAEEGLVKTANGLISIAKPIPMDEDALWEQLDMLREAAYEEREDMKQIMSSIVPTYNTNNEEVNKKFKK